MNRKALLRKWLLAFLLLAVASPAAKAEPKPVEDRLDKLERLYQALSTELVAERKKSSDLGAKLQQVTEQMNRAQSGGRSGLRYGQTRVAYADRLDALFADRPAGEIASSAGAGGSIVDRTKVGGYFDMEYHGNGRGSDDSNFDQHRFVISIDSKINNRLSFYSELELEGGAEQSGTKTITPTVGNSFNNKGGGGEISVEQAFLDVKLLDERIQARAGALLVPMGRLNQLHDSPIREFTERPLPDRLVVPTTWTEAGFGLHGVLTRDVLTGLPSGSSLDYQLYLVNGLRGGDGRRDSKAEDQSELAATIGDIGFRDARAGLRDDNNSDKAVTGRLGFNFDPLSSEGCIASFAGGTKLGLSFYHGALDDAERVDLNMVGVDIRTRFGHLFEETLGFGPGPNGSPRVEFVGEYYRAMLSGGNDGPGGIPDGLYGWYGEWRVRFMPDFILDGLPEDMQKTALFTGLFRYSQIDLDTGITSSGDRGRTEVGLNFRPYPNFVIKSEYQMNDARKGHANDKNQFIFSVAVGF